MELRLVLCPLEVAREGSLLGGVFAARAGGLRPAPRRAGPAGGARAGERGGSGARECRGRGGGGGEGARRRQPSPPTRPAARRAAGLEGGPSARNRHSLGRGSGSLITRAAHDADWHGTDYSPSQSGRFRGETGTHEGERGGLGGGPCGPGRKFRCDRGVI